MPASNPSASTAASTSDREIVFTRVFDAPQELVFRSLDQSETHPALVGPPGLYHYGSWRWTCGPAALGVSRCLGSPDGKDYKNHIVFEEVVKPLRLVFRHEPEPGSEPATHQSTVTFTAQGDKTEVIMRLVFDSPR